MKWIFIYKVDSLHFSIWQHHGLSSQFLQFHCTGPNLIPGQSMWELWWIKWHWDRLFPPSEHFSFLLSVSFHQRSTFVFMYMLLVLEWQTGKAWEPSKKQCSFRNWEVLETTALSLFFLILQGIKNQSANYTLHPDTSTTITCVSSSKMLLIKIPNA